MSHPLASPTVTVRIEREQAEQLSLGLSDLLCWMRGFEAARRGTDLDFQVPMGVEAARNLNILLKAALE